MGVYDEGKFDNIHFGMGDRMRISGPFLMIIESSIAIVKFNNR